MDAPTAEFERILMVLLTRFFEQNAQAVPVTQQSRMAAQLGALLAEHGLPRPLRDDEKGTPGGMTEQECAPLITRVMDGIDNPELAEAARQLVKACFHPEFKVCRDSFREVARDGSCRRQEVGRVRRRLSGSHCIDCPHWVALSPPEHARYLNDEWRGDRQELADHITVFLPEDFRMLRRWLHSAARRARVPS